MQLFVAAVVALLAAPGALAAPALVKPRPSRSLRTEVRHRLYEERKHGVDRRAAVGRDEASFGSYWFCPATAGGQAVEVLIDTGSADLWLLSPSVAADQQAGLPIYDPSQSSSASQLPDAHFAIGYGTGGNGVSGPVYHDTFAVGSVSVPNMPIGSARTLTGLPDGNFKSGIMGLAFQTGNSVNPHAQPTFMEALQAQLERPVFVCNFKIGGGGFLEFGRVDPTLFRGRLTGIRADNATTYPGSWSSEGVAYVSNGRTLGTFDLVFDTGGPSTSGPLPVVRAYYAQIPGARDVHGDGSAWTVPCDAAMPDLAFHFRGGAIATIPGAKMLQPANADGSCSAWLVKENSATRGLVGDAFFDSHVVIFDQSAATISWAPQA